MKGSEFMDMKTCKNCGKTKVATGFKTPKSKVCKACKSGAC